jgi:hypothetical protein
MPALLLPVDCFFLAADCGRRTCDVSWQTVGKTNVEQDSFFNRLLALL